MELVGRRMVGAPVVKMQERGPLFSLAVASAAVFLLLPLFSVYGNDLRRQDSITLTDERDRRVYTIGPGENEAAKDDEKAWHMLRGVVIDARGSCGKGPDNNR